MTSTEDLIGRAEVDDLESILAITNRDTDEIVHAVQDNAAAIFTWDYEKGARPALNKLYEKAKTAQWNGETDLPWETEVDQEKVVLANAAANNGLNDGMDLTGTQFEHWTDDEWLKQIMVEGLALAAFGFIHQLTTEPLLKKLLRYVMADEARHVAFGVLSLKEYYDELSLAELRERQEFAFEAAVRMRDRFLMQEVWDRLGVDVKPAIEIVMRAPQRQLFQQMLFSKIVPNCKKLGLLDAGDGWLRQRFGELGVIQFEDWADTGDEYDSFAIGSEAEAAVGT